MWAALLLTALQDGTKASLSVAEHDGAFHYRVAATTDLPDGTVVGITMQYVSTGADGAEEVNKIWHNGGYIKGSARVTGGAFEAELGRFTSEPFPIHYRVVVSDEDDKTVATADLPADAARMEPRLAIMRDSLIRDFDAVEALFLELRDKFTSIQAGQLSVDAWDGWKDGFLDRLDELQAANADRHEIWVIWTERSGKLKLEGLHITLKELVADGSKILAAADGKRDDLLARARRGMEAFQRNYHYDRDNLSLEKPASNEARAAFAEASTSLAELATYVDQVMKAETPPESYAATMQERRLKLAAVWVRIAQEAPIRGQEPVQNAVSAVNAWFDAALDDRAKLADARRAMDAALAALEAALNEK